MRDFKTSEFTKTVGITEEDLDYLKAVKGKKSAAGFLKEIIKKAEEVGFKYFGMGRKVR